MAPLYFHQHQNFHPVRFYIIEEVSPGKCSPFLGEADQAVEVFCPELNLGQLVQYRRVIEIPYCPSISKYHWQF
jgi:hypothetical protein